MDCPVIVIVLGDNGLETELHPLGRRSLWHEQEDTRFLSHRFPGFCPHHILHNLLGLHYGRHESCAAAPFSDQRCRHGSHQRPSLSREEMLHAAPAEGAVIFLPFGLSRRAGDGLLVAGCADCEQLLDGDVCGSCRRRWNAGAHYPVPANGSPGLGRLARLAGWRAAVDLTGEEAGEAPVTEEWREECSEEEWWGEEEWEEEAEEDWGDAEEEWEDAEEAWDGAASWGAGGEADYGGGGVDWQAQGGPAGAEDDGWGAGRWVEDRWGGWEWVVDFAAPAAASTVPAAIAPAPDVAAVAAAAVQAVLAAGATPAAQVSAGAAASAPDVSERIRILELELEIEQLKRRRLA